MEKFKREENAKHTVVQYPYTIEEESEHIWKLIQSKPTLTFTDIFTHCKNRMHAVYTFLALLEMIQVKTITFFLRNGFNNFFVTSAEINPAEAN